MEKNKRRLAGRLFCLALGVVFVLRATGYIREIRGGRESIAHYRKALNSERPLPAGYLSRLEERLVELRSLETAGGTAPSAAQVKSEDPAGAIRNALRAHAIGVEQLRTLSMGGTAATEFILSSAPVDFLVFCGARRIFPCP
jgi:type II secretory pathway component PulM